MNRNEAFGKVIESHIKERKIKKYEFANQAGISRGYLFRLFNGQFSPTLDTIFLISKALDITPEELILETRKLSNSK